MLFNHCQKGLFVHFEGRNLRRAGVCFPCREIARNKLETWQNFPFPWNLQNTFKDWKVLRYTRTWFEWDMPNLSTAKWVQPRGEAAWPYNGKDINFLLLKWISSICVCSCDLNCCIRSIFSFLIETWEAIH